MHFWIRNKVCSTCYVSRGKRLVACFSILFSVVRGSGSIFNLPTRVCIAVASADQEILDLDVVTVARFAGLSWKRLHLSELMTSAETVSIS